MPNPYTYFLGSVFVQRPAPASTPSITPPVFAGITGTTANLDGSITASWTAGTAVNPPISYAVYIALGSVSAGALFQSGNIQKIVPSGTTSTKVFLLADQATYLINGTQYTLGVRARDAYGNTETNTAILVRTATASGNLPAVFQSLAASLAVTDTNLSADHVNFQSDHANFQADHSDFQADHTNLQADHANFQADHANFQTDHSDLQTEIAAFQSENTTLSATSGDLQDSADVITQASSVVIASVV